MASRRSTLRRRWAPRSGAEQIAAGVIALVAVLWLVQAVIAMGGWLLIGWPVLVGLGVVALVALGVWGRRRAMADRKRSQRLARLRLSLAEIDRLDDRQFEFALRDLMIRDGCMARRVGQQGDQAADVIAQHPRQGRIVLQAKHTTVGGKVGSHVMYQVKGTAGPVHGADIGVVITNGSLTRDAKAWGDKHHVYWVDRERLRQWAEHGTPLNDLLHLPAAARRRLAGAHRGLGLRRPAQSGPAGAGRSWVLTRWASVAPEKTRSGSSG